MEQIIQADACCREAQCLRRGPVEAFRAAFSWPTFAEWTTRLPNVLARGIGDYFAQKNERSLFLAKTSEQHMRYFSLFSY